MGRSTRIRGSSRSHRSTRSWRPGPQTWARVREGLRALATGPDAEPATVAIADVELLLPVAVRDYVDFYSSLDHATNVGRLFRPDADPLPPNWRHLPVGYHGRSGTVVVSGTPIRRPRGQRLEAGADAPVFGPSMRLDVELELGFVVGVPSALGEPVAVERRARPRLRRAAGQRLERARHPGVGVPPARPVPGQVVRHLGCRVGHAASGDPRSPRRGPGPGARRRCPICARSRGRWTSTSRSSSTAPSSRVPTRAISTGRRPSSSRT